METAPQTILFETTAQWEHWLEANHHRPEGVWVKVAKKGSGVTSITIPEALDGALCFGWIDSVRHGLDDRFFLQRYTPRRAVSSSCRSCASRA